ncbi:hypothetical protein B0T18DRAFT_401930 [Schizothecium vesticola]|uniref:Replication protein A C-terminal domain-containing protein n=1 Tax=Schizothecium vesticola TaxID=314040 RepID=A0AA40F547_9PEZI|nr:hypothetical protein B0T18DRAFT_401930 [Schizothecium vesticola]
MAYGGYNNEGGGGGGGGGGFNVGGSQQGSSQAGGGSKYNDDTLRPVTIKQLLECKEPYPGADLMLDGQSITQITLVGQVRSVQPQTTNITYRIDDGTGLTDVKKWVDAEKADTEGANTFAPDTYVRVFGRLSSFNGKRHVGAHFIRAVEDFNEVNYHLLEATYVHLYLTKGPPTTGDGAAAGGGAGGAGDSMFVDNGAGGAGGVPARVLSCSKGAQNMFSFLHNSPGGNEGLNLAQISNGTGMTTREIINASDELLGQGAIYTTIDDETWAVLDY